MDKSGCLDLAHDRFDFRKLVVDDESRCRVGYSSNFGMNAMDWFLLRHARAVDAVHRVPSFDASFIRRTRWRKPYSRSKRAI
jgi:hypothetical protein